MDNEFDPKTTSVQQALSDVNVFTRIKRGGQKIIYEAEHPQYGRIALKIIKPGSSRERDRVIREVSAVRQLVGPWFPKIYHIGVTMIDKTEVLYIYEEYLEGNLTDILSAKGKLSLKETWNLVLELLKALVAISRAGIVHRDIKPANIFITPNGRVVLIDFGIARHLQLPSITYDCASSGPLTPGYAAPEQINNQKRKIDSRTDLLALGIVIYECLTGQNPFTENCDPREALERNLKFHPPSLTDVGIADCVSQFVDTCIQKHSSRRYSDPEKALEVWASIEKEVC